MTKQRESALLVMSDLHIGKQTPSYDHDVATVRLKAFSKKVALIHELLSPGYDFDELVIALLGDVADGALIYPTQTHYQSITSVREQCEVASDLLNDLLLEQADVWGNVRVECTPGNHGRLDKRMSEGDNCDLIVYDRLSLLNRDERVSVVLPDPLHDPFLRKCNIYGHGFLCHHGQSINFWNGMPHYGIDKRVGKWKTHIDDWEVALFGHFHRTSFADKKRFSIFTTGTLVSDDEWALRQIGEEASNSWWLCGVSPKHATTWKYDLSNVEG